MVGWLKLHRKFSEWEWYNKSEMVHLFIHLLIFSNFEKKSWQGVTILRGQLLTGRKELSAKTGISEQSLRTCLKRLENTGEILVKSTSNYSLITICNYESYQGEEKEINQRSTSGSTNDQPTINQQSTSGSTTTKEENKEIIKEPHSPYYAKFDFQFVGEWAKEAFRTWLQYKFDREEPLTTQITIEKNYAELSRLTMCDKVKADELIDYLITKQKKDIYPMPEQKTKPTNVDNLPKAITQKESDEIWRQEILSRQQAK